jgi:hypothetical protein
VLSGAALAQHKVVAEDTSEERTSERRRGWEEDKEFNKPKPKKQSSLRQLEIISFPSSVGTNYQAIARAEQRLILEAVRNNKLAD